MAASLYVQDNHRFIGPLGAQYRQIGNAVPPLLAKAVALEIRGILEEQFPLMPFKSSQISEISKSPPDTHAVALDPGVAQNKAGATRRRAAEVDELEDGGREAKRLRLASDGEDDRPPDCVHQ